MSTLFGAASGIYSFSNGQDIFRDDGRAFLHPGKGYAGLLYANQETGDSAQLSFGRQTWTLNNGFLVSMIAGSSNAGERGATYLGPRNNTDFTALATGEFGKSRFSLFYIDPDELESLESNTTFVGANIGWQFTDALWADASFITIPDSDSTYRTPSGATLAREGTNTYGVHALWRPTSPDHFWLEGEAYHQSNPISTCRPMRGTARSDTSRRASPGAPAFRIAMPASRATIPIPAPTSGSTR